MLVIDYSTAIDQSVQFDDLDRVFTPEAHIDYRGVGRDRRPLGSRRALHGGDIAENLQVRYAHYARNFDVRIDGDTASSRTICFNPMCFRRRPDSTR